MTASRYKSARRGAKARGLDDEEFRGLSAGQRAAVVTALVLAFGLDDGARDQARQQLSRTVTKFLHLGVRPTQLDEAIDDASARVEAIRGREGVVALGRACGVTLASEALREKVVWEMLAIANADDVYREGEFGGIRAFAEGLGLSDERWHALLDTACASAEGVARGV
jgi:hypothetical protein